MLSIKNDDAFETAAARPVYLLRQASTKEYKEASSKGFSILAGFFR
jgi:hypothetical protein